MSTLNLPSPGVIFWPVGCGDSTTVVVDEQTIVQIDLHHVEDSEAEDDPRTPIVDELIELLPLVDGNPYLAAFGATHLDRDHIQGFAELLDRDVVIGELWFTPRILWELEDDPDVELSEDAQAFVVEAERRIELVKAEGAIASGNRIRIIGSPDALRARREIYQHVPDEAITVPGTAFAHIDGEDESERFSAFVHAPFKDDTEGERNDTSFAFQVTLTDGETSGRALLFGDLSYPTIRRIFDRSEAETLAWDVFLAPHHCSKSVMYFEDETQSADTPRQDILDDLEAAKHDAGHVVASSIAIPAQDTKNANPPHAKAAARYRELVDDGHFLCTAEHPTEDSPEPIVFEVDGDALVLRAPEGKAAARSSPLSEAVRTARGAAAPAAHPVGFGRA